MCDNQLDYITPDNATKYDYEKQLKSCEEWNQDQTRKSKSQASKAQNWHIIDKNSTYLTWGIVLDIHTLGEEYE